MSINAKNLNKVLRAANGAELVPLSITARLLGYATQTLYNQIHEKRCVLQPVRLGRGIRFHAEDIAARMSEQDTNEGGCNG